MSEWSQLPNAHHIDWVIKVVKENRQLWNLEVGANSTDLWHTAWESAWTKGDVRPRKTAFNAASNSIWNAVGWTGIGRSSVRGMILALVAYDDCDQYLSMGYEKLRVYAELSEKPQAILLLPMVYVREEINERMVTIT